jgi:hypothetical protein
MTTFVYKALGFYVKSDTQQKTLPVIAVDPAGNLVLPVSGTTTFGVPIKGTNGTTYYLTATTTAPT